MRNTLVALALAGTLAGGAVTTASAGGGYYHGGYAPHYYAGHVYAPAYTPHYAYGPAYGYAPHPYYYKKRRNDVGKAVALGIIGAAAAAIIASQHQKPRRYRYR